MKRKEFETWQRWDEFPEAVNNPPMTVDFSFKYKSEVYCVIRKNDEYQICDSNGKIIFSNSNFLILLSSPIWDGKSFMEAIENIVFLV